MSQCLKLNASYMPIDIISWQEAITLWVSNKAEIISTYEDKLLHTGNRFDKPDFYNKTFIKSIWDEKLESWKTVIEMPAVIRLFDFVSPKKNLKFFENFTRQNIYNRDGGICMYCGQSVTRNKFTFDHVIPKSRGGKTSWTNIVCCCLKCNSRKNNRTPIEAGMKLIKKPFAPIIADDFNTGVLKRLKEISRVWNNEKWLNWIYWNVELKQE
jgi:5-methylcytosine-specific restriction endonuclease McrA